MAIVAMQPVQQAGVGVYLYVADDANTLYALNTNGTSTVLEEGAYWPVFTGGQQVEDKWKRGKRLWIFGDGTDARAQLTLQMDGQRTLVQNLTGPYDINQKILFYCEFDPTIATAQQFIAKIDMIRGTNVQINDVRFDYTLID